MSGGRRSPAAPRVLIDPTQAWGSVVTLDDPAQVHHLLHVLRVQPGQPVRCFDGAGTECHGILRTASSRTAVIDIERVTHESDAGCHVWLVQSLIKHDRFEWSLEKATELGVARISPVVTTRTVVRPPAGRADARASRWLRILQAAAKQCGRATVPRLDPISPLNDLLPTLRPVSLVLIPTLETTTSLSLSKAVAAHGRAKDVAVLIGPEGDFTRDEVARAERYGARPVSLGRLTLRAETAAIAVLALLALQHAAHS